MTMKTFNRLLRARRASAASLALILAMLAASLPGLAYAASYPKSMAALGDSITRAFNDGWFPFTDAPAYSWSTGTDTTVNSVYLRIKALNPSITGKNYNDAKTGAKMSDLLSQVNTANGQHVDFVTTMMGTNDVCTSSVGTMTSVTTFHDQFQAAMQSLTSASRKARIQVMSIPNVYHLWELLKDNSNARGTWSLFMICQSLLANPLSTAQADVDRRNAVKQRTMDDNAQLQTVCAMFDQCQFDNYAAFNYVFQTKDVSTFDYFHPSREGQRVIAACAWNIYTGGTTC
jgi:lysophospholipase L1-like esterase